MGDYFETMGVAARPGAWLRCDQRDRVHPRGRRLTTLVGARWKDLNPIGQRLRPCCGDRIPWFTVVGVAKDVKQGGVDQKTGTEFYFLVDQTAPAPFNQAPTTMNLVLRTTLPPCGPVVHH